MRMFHFYLFLLVFYHVIYDAETCDDVVLYDADGRLSPVICRALVVYFLHFVWSLIFYYDISKPVLWFFWALTDFILLYVALSCAFSVCRALDVSISKFHAVCVFVACVKVTDDMGQAMTVQG